MQITGSFEGIFNSTTNGITAKKAIRNNGGKIIDFQFTAVNKAFAQLFNMSINDLLGHSFKQVYGDSSDSYFYAYLSTVETGQEAKFEYYNKRHEKWFETTVVKMLDGVVATHVDITERKHASNIISNNFEDLKKTTDQLRDSYTQLERSNIDLMQFASVASHDLKETLRKIQTFGNILQSKLKDKLIFLQIRQITLEYR